jgi:hypothetical protein
MDLNLPPESPPQLRSSFMFKVEVRKKIAYREFFVRKYGEETYSIIIGSELPFIISGHPRRDVILHVFIFV